jgi:hypothetical protein
MAWRGKASPVATKEHPRGSTQATDVSQQHEIPPRSMEGNGPATGGVPAVPGAEAAAHRVPGLRDLQQTSGDRTFLTPGMSATAASGRHGERAGDVVTGKPVISGRRSGEQRAG